MNEFSQTTTQTITDFAQRIGARELAEQHRHQLSPTGKSLCPTFCTVLAYQTGKLGSGEMFEKLIEQARHLYHACALLFRIPRDTLAFDSWCHDEERFGGLFTLRRGLTEIYFGQVWSMTAPTEV